MEACSVIPFMDLKTQYRGIKGELNAAALAVLESGRYVLGTEVSAFEKEFAAYCQCDQGIAVNSGTSALHLALLAAGIGPGDEVITVPFTFVATAAAIRYTGATPVFVDVEPQTCTMDPARIAQAITPSTKAILPVHLWGQMADMDAIMEIARRYELFVIEDAAQAHGAEYHGRRAGSFGDMGCFSFYPGKNLGACGEGGIVVTNNSEYSRNLRMMRDWGQEEKYHHVAPGFNYRMDSIQGALLRVKLRHLDEWTDARREHAARYDRLLSDSYVSTPVAAKERRHVYHVYSVRTTNREDLKQTLEWRQIQTGIHYPIPVHLQPIHADLGYVRGDFPVSERAADEVLSLPMYPELSGEAIESVAHAVSGFRVLERAA
jgi:dTDP-4-amino-4,6-dideoxygalactose transaminase